MIVFLPYHIEKSDDILPAQWVIFEAKDFQVYHAHNDKLCKLKFN